MELRRTPEVNDAHPRKLLILFIELLELVGADWQEQRRWCERRDYPIDEICQTLLYTAPARAKYLHGKSLLTDAEVADVTRLSTLMNEILDKSLVMTWEQVAESEEWCRMRAAAKDVASHLKKKL